MKNNNFQISAEEQLEIEEVENGLKQLMESIEQSKQFKVGDYLIAYLPDENGKWKLDCNSYGVAYKHVVVYSSPNGYPYIKRLNITGQPIGDLISGWGQCDMSDYIEQEGPIKWELDPDYADSLILQEEYDPTQLHKNKRALWKEVTQYNKANKIDTYDIPPILEFFKTLKIGDMMWTSSSGYYLVQDIKLVSKAKALNTIVRGNWEVRIKGPNVLVLTVVDKNGAVKDIAADFLWRKALYKQRPRTYKELNL